MNKIILIDFRLLFSNEIFEIKQDKIIVVDNGIKITEVLHGNVRASVLFETRNSTIDKKIAKKPKIDNGIKIRLFLQIIAKEIR